MSFTSSMNHQPWFFGPLLMTSGSSNGSSCQHFFKYRNTKMQIIQNILRGWPMVGAASKVYGWPHAGVGGGCCGCGCPSRHDHFDQPGSIWNEDEKKKVNIKNYHFLAVPVGTIILTSSTLKRSQEVSETKMRRRRGLNKHYNCRGCGRWKIFCFALQTLTRLGCFWISTPPSTFALVVIIRDHDHCWISMHLKLPPQMREEWYSRLTQAQRRIEMVPRQALNSRRHQKCLPRSAAALMHTQT